MKLEVKIEGSPSLFFPIDKAALSLGSSQSCDISLPIVGVSRKHFIITKEGEDLFITDLGSTNGTFVNEERIKANEKTPLLAFFKVTIGDRILISLVQDEQTGTYQRIKAPAESKSSKEGPETTVMKIDTHRFKQAVTNKPSSGLNMGSIFGIFVLVGSFYWFFTNHSDENHISYDGPVTPVKHPLPQTSVVHQDSNLVPTKDLVLKTQLLDLLKDIKCTLDAEKYLCETFQNKVTVQFGAIQIGTNLNLLIDGSPYLKEAEEIILKNKSLDKLTEKDKNELKINTERVALVLFLLQMPPSFSFEKLDGLKLNIAFFSPIHGGTDYEAKFVAAFLPQSFKKAISELKSSTLKELKKHGAGTVIGITNYYTHL